MNPFLKWGCLTPLAVVVFLVAGAAVADRVLPSVARKALPMSATNVREYYSGSWNGDYVRCLKAKLPEADVPTYAGNLGLTNRFDPVAHGSISGKINTGIGGAPSWWTPPQASPSTYFNYTPGKDGLQVLTYSGGYVYFVSAVW